jgi:hypothetical protein
LAISVEIFFDSIIEQFNIENAGHAGRAADISENNGNDNRVYERTVFTNQNYFTADSAGTYFKMMDTSFKRFVKVVILIIYGKITFKCPLFL